MSIRSQYNQGEERGQKTNETVDIDKSEEHLIKKEDQSQSKEELEYSKVTEKIRSIPSKMKSDNKISKRNKRLLKE